MTNGCCRDRFGTSVCAKPEIPDTSLACSLGKRTGAGSKEWMQRVCPRCEALPFAASLSGLGKDLK